MKTITKITTLSFLIFVIHFHCEAQDLTPEQEVFLKFLSLSMKERKIKDLVYPARKNFNSEYKEKDIYVLDKNISIFTSNNQKIKYGKTPFYFLTDAGVFFYNISCYITIEEFDHSQSNGT